MDFMADFTSLTPTYLSNSAIISVMLFISNSLPLTSDGPTGTAIIPAARAARFIWLALFAALCPCTPKASAGERRSFAKIRRNFSAAGPFNSLLYSSRSLSRAIFVIPSSEILGNENLCPITAAVSGCSQR